MKKRVISETPFIRALRNKYQISHYIILTEVPVHYEGKLRIADALVIGNWPSRDPDIHGFEIKSARPNWISELSDPGKADVPATYCDTWSLLTYPGIADPSEIPDMWGHHVLDGHITTLKAPKKLSPKPITRDFLFTILDKMSKQAAQNVETISMEKDYDRGFADGKEAGAAEVDKATGYLEGKFVRQTREIDVLQARVRELQGGASTQIDIEHVKLVSEYCAKWRPHFGNILKAMDLLSHGSIESVAYQLESLLKQASAIKDFLLPRVSGLRQIAKDTLEQERTKEAGQGGL